ncbi:glucan endo-1,3-beta-glucosidase 12 [Cornus florida]|uniref:glucan endo-1,3-beta-glucosidase 12 n=1 Tax=Cornus florida TaxID=4283 RepID=UPI0028A1EBC8|nr:glucan endo-1,3-beta-glucosidase 12 [Cornus florida]
MSLSLKNSTFISLLFLSLLIAGTASLPATIGVNYIATAHPPPERVASALQALKITSVRLPDPTPAVVRAFSYSNISLLLSVPNNLVGSFAANRSAAALWLYTHVVPFYPRARISTISVGTDVLDTPVDLSDSLLPAVRNLHLSLRDLGINKIAVSTTFTFINVMSNSFPPSSAEFQEPISGLIIKPLLQFLDETNSSFLINLYPYNVYRLSSEIPVGYPLFQEHPFNFRDDFMTGVRYRNLFDMMVDAVICAMAVAGHENIPVIVTETGWPSSGERNEADANPVFAEMYIKGLVNHLKSGLGTPLRKEGVAQTYIYELFDTEEKQGSETGGHNWGILFPNMTQKYAIGLSGSIRVGGGLGKMALGLFLMLASVLLFW